MPGDRRINRNGRPKDGRRPAVGRRSKPSNVLEVMRWVFGNEADRDDTDRKVRRWFDEKPSQFLAHLAKLEEAHARGQAEREAAAAKAARGLDEPEEDEGTRRALEILEAWKEAPDRGANEKPDGGGSERVMGLMAEEWESYKRWLAAEGRGGEQALPGAPGAVVPEE